MRIKERFTFIMLVIIILCFLILYVRGDYDNKKSKHYYETSTIDGLDVRFTLSPSFYNKSILNLGQLSYNTTLKLSKGECLNILNIGGSISCGSSTVDNHYDHPHGKNGAYSIFLERQLNTLWPCTRNNEHGIHKVTNWCYGGRTTASWIDAVVGEPQSLFDTDVILVETSVNDVNEGRDQARRANESPENHIKKATELFIKILSKLPQGPSIIYVGSSTRDMTWRSPRQRTGDSVSTHLPVTNYYHIPYVSAIDALGPFVSDDSLQWFLKVYLVDTCCHPTKTGHHIIAALIYNILHVHKETAISNNYKEHIHNTYINYYNKPPLYVPPELLSQYTISMPLTILLSDNNTHTSSYTTTTTNTTDTTTNGVTILSDVYWSVYEDRPGKPGFISSTIGSICQVRIPHTIIQTHLKSGRIHVELLKSYENMGRVKVTIGIQIDTILYAYNNISAHTTHTSTTTDTTHRTSLSSTSVYHILERRVIDCIWPDKSSQRAIEEFRLNMNTINTYMYTPHSSPLYTPLLPPPSQSAHSPSTTTRHATTKNTMHADSTSTHADRNTTNTNTAYNTTHTNTTTMTTTTTLILDFLVIPSYHPKRANNKIKLFSLLLM